MHSHCTKNGFSTRSEWRKARVLPSTWPAIESDALSLTLIVRVFVARFGASLLRARVCSAHKKTVVKERHCYPPRPAKPFSLLALADPSTGEILSHGFLGNLVKGTRVTHAQSVRVSSQSTEQTTTSKGTSRRPQTVPNGTGTFGCESESEQVLVVLSACGGQRFNGFAWLVSTETRGERTRHALENGS